jgi:hypothetical protein
MEVYGRFGSKLKIVREDADARIVAIKSAENLED